VLQLCTLRVKDGAKMPKIKQGFHVDCVDHKTHYCTQSMEAQVTIYLAHRNCESFSSLGQHDCDEECSN